MDGMDGLNRAMRYIEENLTADIDWDVAARLACCSEYHFRRLFSFLSGVSLSEYVRRRRLTLASYELRQGGGRVVDVALKYGYESPDSFGRAFQAMHGFSPSEARAGDRPFATYPRMTFQLTIRGGSEMKVRFVDKEAFRIAGLKRRVKLVYEGVNPEIAAMWSLLNEETIRRLKELSNVEPAGLVSASANFGDRRLATDSDDHGELDHCIGAATTRECPVGFDAIEAPAGTWAVFEAVGPFPATLQDVWGRIYSEWFPSSGYELAEGPELLWNESKDTSSPNYRSEIWIPVKRSRDVSSM